MPRKLKARWAMEAEQDLRAMHNSDAAAALAFVLSHDFFGDINSESKEKPNWKKEGF